MKLQDLVRPDTIIAELSEIQRSGVIRELVQKLADAGHLDSAQVDTVAKSIVTRERSRGSTGIGKGVAIPHTKIPGLNRVIAAVGRSSKGVDFAALDAQPVYVVFLIVSPEGDAEAHLSAMDVVFRSLQLERFRRFFRQSDTPDKIYDLLGEADRESLVA